MSTDPILGTLAYPCEACGVEAGQECAEDCPTANMSFAEYEAQQDEFDIATGAMLPREVRPMDESLSILAANVHRLPYGNLVGVRGMGAPDRQDYSPEEYVSRLADWMAEYQPILRAMVDDLQVQSRQRIGLQIERDVLGGVIRRALEGESA